ncbi:hypothetical protein CC78DRAFT_536645 [Lojkania enalia]|uniref:Uncharacterized protein n=1 Tax=Lojkania enalia TaxID=147567 RepID=A0A9P4MWC0_9PLEO|nr:hypothetical protein CC78DRAFT_536645 [Didymosphaeria enalia]
MSREYGGQDLNELAKQAERELNSKAAKQGHDGNISANHASGIASDSTLESGVDESVRGKFPGSSVIYGSGASGAGDNREIPLSEGGDLDPRTGKPYKARDFEGLGGPEDKNRLYTDAKPGNDDVRGNIRQGGNTVKPAGSMSGNLKK